MLDMEISTILPEGLIVELFPIVSNKCVGQSESTDNRLPEEFSDFGLSNMSQGFCFHPLGEVVDCD